MFGASWLEDTTGILSYPLTQLADGLPPVGAPGLAAEPVIEEPIGTGGPEVAPRTGVASGAASDAAEFAAETTPPARPALLVPGLRREPEFTNAAAAPVAAARTDTVADEPVFATQLAPAPAVSPAIASGPAIVELPRASPPAAEPAPQQQAAYVPAVVGAVAIPTAPDEERMVRQTLQRYRTAYDDLDAHMAQAVWPAVNETALARAFDGLESQRLIFDNCNVQLAAIGRATATCRGSARYVPKVGSRDPRVEPRVWNFTLRKAGDDWQIETARADR
jgi:hypothetical protein